MEILEHINGFYEVIMADQRIHPTHICLYLAVYFMHLNNGNENPVHIKREILMQQAKISSLQTFYKCLRDLDQYGYIKYTPSFSYYLGSLVYIKRI